MLALTSLKMRLCPTNRNSTSGGNVGSAINSDGGIVDTGADGGYVALTARLMGTVASGDFGFPSPRIVDLALPLSFVLMIVVIIFSASGVKMSPRLAFGRSARMA